MQRTALVVDDSKSARFALRRHLEGRGFKVDTADGAEDAYRAIDAQAPDLVFLDHIMPGIDGFTALRHLKADPTTATIPVVICSSNEGAAFVAEARDQGAADVLSKPPTPDQLERLLAALAVSARQSEIDASLAAAVDPTDDALLAALDEPTAQIPAPSAAPSASADEIAALRARVETLETELASLRAQFAAQIDAAQQATVRRVAETLLQSLSAPR
ncbi:response regulator [Solimonas marina]|uniref:Response regulator n=1 Tax=Solimonas marina TaxID=2714601 RepID=A0A969W8V8_9GAMM|nr:response regulator [Solimonas marina]NKF22772.1 response regulator [Solimonas marina]